MKRKQSLMWYILIIVASLFVVLFVGSAFDSETNTNNLIVTSSWRNAFRKWMDVAWWVRLHYKIDLSKYEEIYTNPMEFNEVVRTVQNVILMNIDQRISALWVSDYESRIQTMEDGQYVVIDLWWVHDLTQAKEIIWKTVELEFKVPFEWDPEEVAISRQLFAESLLKQAVELPDNLAQIWAENQSRDVFYQFYNDQLLEELPALYAENLESLDAQQVWVVRPVLIQWVHTIIPALEWFIEEEVIMEWRVISKLLEINEEQHEDDEWNISIVNRYTLEELFITSVPTWVTAQDPVTNEILNGTFFRYASVWHTQTWQPSVLVHFDDRGTQIFCNLTQWHIGKQMAIYVWWVQVTAPVIQDRICQWTAQITWDFTSLEARTMVDELNEGALPAALILAHEEKVSASLWERALRWALLAWWIGLLAVFVYMFLAYWRKKWIVAVITLLSFLIVLFAIVKLFGVALSLSWIAAILLSIGMGVDANILIFERVSEELKAWKSTFYSVTDWYNNSWSAIRDGNITTWFIALLLLLVWTNVFKWFGTMMVVNILITLTILVPLTKYMLLLILWDKK